MILYARVIYDYLRHYEEITLSKVLLNPKEYKDKDIFLAGKIFNASEDGSVFFIHQDRPDKSSGVDVWKAFLGYPLEGSGIRNNSAVKVYGRFRGIERKSLMPVIKVYRYGKLWKK